MKAILKTLAVTAVCCGLVSSALAEERRDGEGRRRHERREDGRRPHERHGEGRRGRWDGRERREDGDSRRQSWQMAEHKTFLDVRYAEKRAELPPDDPDQDRTLDIHIPNGAKPASGWPVVVFIHGGGFSSGSKAPTRGVGPIFNALLAKGYAVVSINYLLTRKNRRGGRGGDRRGMKDGFPSGGKFDALFEQAIEDASTDADLALKWLDAHAKDYGFDKSSVAVMGGSAGAITALYATYVKKAPNIRAVVNCWGGIADTALIKDKSIPIFTVHGDKDDVINVCYGRGIQKRMEELGSKASRLVVLEGFGHAQYGHVARSFMDEIASFLGSAMKQEKRK
jgi:predicted esterase